jgi:membrane dipeptidase
MTLVSQEKKLTMTPVTPTIIVDAHEDIAYNTFKYNRDYRRSALKTRQAERQAGLNYDASTIGLPEAIVGRVAIVFSTLFVAPKSTATTLLSQQGYSEEYETPREAYDLAIKQLEYYERLQDESDKIRLIKTAADLDAVLSTWEEGKSVMDRQQGFVVLMEGADPILEPRQFEEWYERGVRIVGLAWGATRYTAGTGNPGRLTGLGHELLEVMSSFKALLDLSHMAEDAYLEAVDLYDGAIIASHSNPRRFRNTDRHLTDAQILRLAARDGVIGVVLFNRFLSERWERTHHKSTVKLDVVLDAVDYICQLTGSSAHVGIGSDFDGGFGSQHIPDELDTVADLWQITERLRQRGYSEADIQQIAGGNMLRKLRQVLA